MKKKLIILSSLLLILSGCKKEEIECPEPEEEILIKYKGEEITEQEVIKEAQLCWINPPMLQSLIGYVMQRLSAIIFQILGLILLKLWAMLNLDCISRNTVNTISQINAALAGITDLLGSLDKLSINFSDSNSANWKTLKETIKKYVTEFCNNQQSELKKIEEEKRKVFS